MKIPLVFAPILLGACFGARGYPVTAHPSLVQAVFRTGIGSGTIVCRACEHAGSMAGPTVTMQFADRVSPHLRIGWGADWWWHFQDDWERDIWNFNAVALYYPRTMRRGFFLGGGPTFSMMFATVTDSTELQHAGWGFTAEMGYDTRPGSTASLTPYLQYSRAWVGDIDYPLGSGVPWARGWRHQVLSVGVGIALH